MFSLLRRFSVATATANAATKTTPRGIKSTTNTIAQQHTAIKKAATDSTSNKTTKQAHTSSSSSSSNTAQKPIESAKKDSKKTSIKYITHTNLQPKIAKCLAQNFKIEKLTDVQEKVLNAKPYTDMLVQSRTGTGKTIAFLLPAVHTLLQNPVAADKVGILILSPTRELANQIYDQAVPFAEAMSSQTGAHCAYGGTNVDRKLKEFMYKPSQITIATPGRLLDYMTNPDAVKKFSDLRVLVLDEADSMLDMGFMPQVRKILDFLPKKAVAKWQGLLYSATLPAKMDQTAHLVLEPGFTHISTIDKGESQALDKVAQYQYTVSDLRQASYALFDLIFKEMDLKPEGFKCIVFLPTAKQCVLAEEHFHVPGLNKYTLHSRMTQPKRISVTEAFRSCRRGILFATDVVGRGIDFPDVSLVVQSGLPRDAESYVHRLGRTARAGKEGKGVILLTKFEVPFLGTLKNMNLQPYPDTNISERARGEHDRLLRNVHLVSKNKAYQAMLGYYKERSKITGLVGAALVQRINEYALNTLKCEQVPGLHAQTIGKMGLRNVAGVRKISKSEWEAENTKDDEDVRQRNLV